MIRPGKYNGLGDVAELLVGDAEDHGARTGVTVVLAEQPALAAVDVRGGAPGTINTDLLRPGVLISKVDGIVLSGGSVFGLEAATGLTAWLAERGRGFTDWGPCLPIVSGAILFDLVNGGDRGWGGRPPYRDLAQRAADAVGSETALGNVGAGLGSVAGRSRAGWGRHRQSMQPPGSRRRRWSWPTPGRSWQYRLGIRVAGYLVPGGSHGQVERGVHGCQGIRGSGEVGQVAGFQRIGLQIEQFRPARILPVADQLVAPRWTATKVGTSSPVSKKYS